MGFLNPYLPNNYNPYGQQYQQPVPQPQSRLSMAQQMMQRMFRR